MWIVGLLAPGEAQGGPAKFRFEDVAGQITLVHPLHDNDEGAVFLVIETRRHRFVPKTQCLLSRRITRATDGPNIVRIIEYNNVTALAGDHPGTAELVLEDHGPFQTNAIKHVGENVHAC